MALSASSATPPPTAHTPHPGNRKSQPAFGFGSGTSGNATEAVGTVVTALHADPALGKDHHFAIFCFFFGRAARSSSAGPSLSPSPSASASAISSSLSSLLSWFSSNSSPTSDSDSVLKSSSMLSSSSSALPRLATSPSLEARSSSWSAAARIAPDYGRTR